MALPRVSKKGFELQGDGGSALLLHGYTGTPYDLRPLGDFLNKAGFHVLAPLLKGHGRSPRDLLGVKAKDWVLEARQALKSLSTDKPIIVAGLSMGALLAILLASEQKVDALILCSPALSLGPIAEITLFMAELGVLDKKSSWPKFSGSDIADQEAKLKTPAYKEIPIGGLLEFAHLRSLAQKKLSRIRCPIFLAFGRKDQTIDAEASRQIMLTACTKTTIFAKSYENSKHVITLDYDKDQLFSDIRQFLYQQLGI